MGAPRTKHPAPSTPHPAPALAAALILAAAACGGTPSLEISLIGSPDPTAVEVRGLPAADLAALSSLARDQWPAVFPVQLMGGAATQAMAGEYTVHDGRVRFTPMYGFDKGRQFGAVFHPALIPGAGAEPWRRKPLEYTFSVAAAPAARSTSVRQIYPSGATLPENMLRFYIEFSAPMGRGRALEHIRLEDESGNVVVDPFLPVEAEFWNPERTRFTLFFDPGRVKRGIKPNRDLGRALEAGKRYTLVIHETWIDARGQPLTQEYRHPFTAGGSLERALDTTAWTVTPPRAASRDPLVVEFPWPLDYGLLQRAVDVEARGSTIPGEIRIDRAESRWTFTPRDGWVPGDYALVVQTLLEDPAGNRIGRAFEVMRPADESKDRVEIGFSVR